jgi:NAD(P)-dependent dehydrogenase (short-subunit alcohol dehydrogenase family)
MAKSNGKVALVTGANKGIGLEAARQLGKLGFTVLVGARDAAKGKLAVADLTKEGIDVHLVTLDTAKPADRDAAAKFIEERFGKLDVLINNAGVSLDKGAAPSAVSEKVLRDTFETNFFAVVALTQKLLPLIRKSEAGRIVNLSSILGSLTEHSDPKSMIYQMKPLAYDSSKTAINAFTVHLAYELRHTPIKVNAAHPGWVKTDMGGPEAPMTIVDGAKTSVRLATLPASGPTGGFVHFDRTIAW